MTSTIPIKSFSVDELFRTVLYKVDIQHGRAGHTSIGKERRQNNNASLTRTSIPLNQLSWSFPATTKMRISPAECRAI